MSRIRWYGPSIVLFITIIACLLIGPQVMRNIAWAKTDVQITQASNRLTSNKTLEALDSAFTDISQKVEPSVVYIEILAKHPPRRSSLLQRFFGPNNPFAPQDRRSNPFGNDKGQNNKKDMQKYNQPIPIGSGSGWVFDKKGHIITNNHVVAHADKLIVKFHDGTKEVAKVIGTDPDTDIAVIQVQRKNLHPATVDTKPVHQGDLVFAFGSPFEFKFSMSMGIVSAKGRQLGLAGTPTQRGYENYIQTDAAINPGNSGGPLTNIYGQVIGMNSAIASKTGQNNGLGFAIPAKLVVSVAKQLISNADHKVHRGYLGVYISDLTPKMAKTFNYKGKGVLVVNPIDGSPAAKAGLKAGDIITRINGQKVSSSHDLRFAIAGMAPGTKVKVDIFRDGKELGPKTITLGTLPSNLEGSANGDSSGSSNSDTASGISSLHKWGVAQMSTFTQKMADNLHVPFTPGVLVDQVRPQSIAQGVGVTRGTIIAAVMGKKVTSVNELATQVQKYDLTKQPVRLRVLHYNRAQNKFMPFYIVMDLTSLK